MNLLKILFLISIYLMISNAQQWQVFNKANSNIPDNRVSSIFIDENNVKWFGTNNGLVSFNGSEWKSYSTSQGLSGDVINAIKMSNDNKYWIATNDGVSEVGVNNSDLTITSNNYNTGNSGILTNKTTSVEVDSNNVKWFGSFDGISLLIENVWQTITGTADLGNKFVRQIVHRYDGYNYIATEGGVSRIKYVDGISSASLIEKEWSGLPSDTINCILFDSVGYAWYGTPKGVGRHFGDNTKKNWSGFYTESGLVDNCVFSIYEDNSKYKWFGTANGISRFKSNQWQNWSTTELLAGDSVFAISQDSDGSLWFCTNNGILNFNPEITGVNEKSRIDNIKEYNLSAYPNPFNAGTVITYKLPKDGTVELSIYDLSGKMIEKVINKFQSAGAHQFQFNAVNLASGIYFYRLKTNDLSLTKKLLLLK